MVTLTNISKLLYALVLVNYIYPVLSTISSLSKPTNLRISYTSDAKLVNLAWLSPEESEGKIDGFIILYTQDHFLNDRLWKKEKVSGQKETIDLLLKPDSEYFVKVKPIIDCNRIGPVSDVLKFKTNPATVYSQSSYSTNYEPNIVKIIPGDISTTVDVIWEASELDRNKIQSYQIYYALDKRYSKWSVVIIENASDLDDIQYVKLWRTTIGNLIVDTPYKFIVKVKTYETNIDFSSPVFKYTTEPKGRKRKSGSNKETMQEYSIYTILTGITIYFLNFCKNKFIENRTQESRYENNSDRDSNSDSNRDSHRNRTNSNQNRLRDWLRQATIYMANKNYEDAVRMYEMIYSVYPTNQNKKLLDNAKYMLKMSKKRDYFGILGVKRTATLQEVRIAYRELALKYHPDKCSNATESVKKKHEKIMKEINEAYSELKKRFLYNM